MKYLKICKNIIFSFIAFFAFVANVYAVVPQSGWWWNPAEGGRGFALEVQNGTIYLAGYLYDPSGRATWLAAGPAAMSGSTFSAPLITYLGGQSLTGTYHPVTGTMNSGNVSIVFSDPSHGVMTWPGGTVPIERFNIVAGGVNAPVSPTAPQTGWWWNPAEGGRGYTIEVQNGTLYMAGYMYDAAGNPTWYTFGPILPVSTDTYQGVWQQYGNGQTLTGLFKPAQMVNANVGNVTLKFQSPTVASLTMPNGVVIPLSRFQFGSSIPTVASFSGNYSGSFSGADNGTFSVSLGNDGRIIGTGYSTVYNLTFNVSGTVSSSGSVSMTSTGYAGSATFSGSIDSANGSVTGRWSVPNTAYSGIFSGLKR